MNDKKKKIIVLAILAIALLAYFYITKKNREAEEGGGTSGGSSTGGSTGGSGTPGGSGTSGGSDTPGSSGTDFTPHRYTPASSSMNTTKNLLPTPATNKNKNKIWNRNPEQVKAANDAFMEQIKADPIGYLKGELKQDTQVGVVQQKMRRFSPYSDMYYRAII